MIPVRNFDLAGEKNFLHKERISNGTIPVRNFNLTGKEDFYRKREFLTG